jgi:hypothetical protein
LKTTLALAALAFAVTASSGAAATPARSPILGIVPHSSTPVTSPHLATKAAVRADSPTALAFDTQYENMIDRYLTDVAHDSGGVDNVYSVATQYYDNPAAVHVQYSSTFGGSYVDHDPLPKNGCSDGISTYCLSDQQLHKEIQAVLTVTGWSGGLDHVFFLMTPNGVASCFDAGECSTNTFCAYHSDFTDSNVEHVLYANEPYEGTDPAGGCTDPLQGFPNDTHADTTINTISHEHNEAITDPLTEPDNLAWVAADGAENGDLCAYSYGVQAGGTPGVDAYNQVINGHHYELQQEWSNADGGCVQKLGGSATPATFGAGPLAYQGGPVMHTNTTYAIYWLPTARNTGRPALRGSAAVHAKLTTTPGSWAGGASSFSYQWQRCSSTGRACADISGATSSTYRLTAADGGHVVRSTVSATNLNGASPRTPSTGTARVLGVPAATRAPHVSGRARVGKKLAGSRGSWTYHAAFRFQWLRCNARGGSCSSIGHATRSTYRPTQRDAGHRLRLRVTASNAAGSKRATSSPTAPVAP